MPKKKNGEEDVVKRNSKNEKKSAVTKSKVNEKIKGRDKVKEVKKALSEGVQKKQLPKPAIKKELPAAKEKKQLPNIKEKKQLPDAKKKKELPKAKSKKMLPNVKEKKILPAALTQEEKDLRLLEKIKEFFGKNPEKTTKLDSELEKDLEFLPEYYDLPYRYNETVVKILAQTPKRLFIYWDISDSDTQKYLRAFGEDFFGKTYPVLLVHNEELNYTYEIPINDFANSWYLDIKDSKCKYTVQLGRKFKEIPKFAKETVQIVQEEKINLKNDYIEIVSSNTLEAPNDRVLFDEIKPSITYRNVKTGEESTKDITNILSSCAKVYNVYDLYKAIYKDEFDSDILDLNNPSSLGSSSSSMTSGMFR